MKLLLSLYYCFTRSAVNCCLSVCVTGSSSAHMKALQGVISTIQKIISCPPALLRGIVQLLLFQKIPQRSGRTIAPWTLFELLLEGITVL